VFVKISSALGYRKESREIDYERGTKVTIEDFHDEFTMFTVCGICTRHLPN